MIVAAVAVALAVAWLVIGRSLRPPIEVGKIYDARQLQEQLGLYCANRPTITLDPAKVPAEFRDLIPLAEKWGIGDDIIRGDCVDKATRAERDELKRAVGPREDAISNWTQAALDEPGLEEEVGAFIFLVEAYVEVAFEDEYAARRARVRAPEGPLVIVPGHSVGPWTLEMSVQDFVDRHGAGTTVVARAEDLRQPLTVQGWDVMGFGIATRDGVRVLYLSVGPGSDAATSVGKLTFGSPERSVREAYGEPDAITHVTEGGSKRLIYDRIGIAFAVSDRQYTQGVWAIAVFRPGAAGTIWKL